MKAEIDKYITKDYQKLICIAQKFITYFDRLITAEELVTYAYLEVIARPPDTVEEIPNYVVAYMRQETRFTKSKTNRRNKPIRGLQYEEVNIEDSCNIDIELKFHDFYLKYEEFVKGLSRNEQIVCKVYFEDGKQTIRELAEHFGLTKMQMYTELTKTGLYNKIKQFKDEVKREI